jgi:WD40 repeat protein
VVQCNLLSGRDPVYRYYCAPPDLETTNDLVTSVSALNLATLTPPPKARYAQERGPRHRTSMGFDRGANSSNHQSPSAGPGRNRSKGAKDRIRMLGCVAFSPDQNWIAGGEVTLVNIPSANLKKGYAPRVLVYPNSANNTLRANQKVQVILEHSDGIRSMAFSPCSNFLVSVGTVHDQCIIVYKLTPKAGWVKIAAAKFKDIIDDVVWSKRRIITVGRRHLRVWEWHENSVCSCR